MSPVICCRFLDMFIFITMTHKWLTQPVLTGHVLECLSCYTLVHRPCYWLVNWINRRQCILTLHSPLISACTFPPVKWGFLCSIGALLTLYWYNGFHQTLDVLLIRPYLVERSSSSATALITDTRTVQVFAQDITVCVTVIACALVTVPCYLCILKCLFITIIIINVALAKADKQQLNLSSHFTTIHPNNQPTNDIATLCITVFAHYAQ